MCLSTINKNVYTRQFAIAAIQRYADEMEKDGAPRWWVVKWADEQVRKLDA